MFSKACEYGIKACVFLAKNESEFGPQGVKAISTAIDSPESFTAKILQSLKREGIIESQVGASGGYSLSRRNLNSVTLGKIVNAIDGETIYEGCGLGLKTCNANKPCPMHNRFVKIRADLKNMLESTSINDLKSDLINGKTYLVR